MAAASRRRWRRRVTWSLVGWLAACGAEAEDAEGESDVDSGSQGPAGEEGDDAEEGVGEDGASEDGDGGNDEAGDGATSGADDGGSTGSGEPGTPPMVSIAFPHPGVVVSGADVRLEATVTDPDTVAAVRLLVDGREVASREGAPASLTFDASAAGDGEHELRLVATDARGAQGSASTQMFVNAAGSDGSGGASGDVDRSASVMEVSRDYFLYVPSGYDEDVASPLLTVHHGAGGPTNKGETYRALWRDLAEAEGFIVLAQDSLDDRQGGWLAQDQDFWIAMVNTTLAEYNVDTRRLYVWGFSAGGHFAHKIALESSDAVAAYAVNSGTLGPFGMAPFVATLRRHIPVGIWCGSTDPNLPGCELARDTFVEAGWVPDDEVSFTVFEGFHEIPDGHLEAAWAFLRSRSLEAGR